MSAGYVKEGGSTITQQYIKNAYLNNAKSFERKIDEALLAAELEKELSKEEILFNYVNISFFGSGAYGVGAASEIYFSKHVSEINISEAATLAGLVKAPTAFSPHSNPEAADERRRLVINAMLEEGYITEAEAAEATAAEVKRFSDGDFTLPATFVFDRPSKGSDEFPFFSDWIEQTLVDELGPDQVYRGGLTIQTTLDPELQNAAREAADARLETTEHPVDLSIVSVEPDTGFVRAILGEAVITRLRRLTWALVVRVVSSLVLLSSHSFWPLPSNRGLVRKLSMMLPQLGQFQVVLETNVRFLTLV